MQDRSQDYHRVLLRITSRGPDYIRVKIPSWHPHKLVIISNSQLPSDFDDYNGDYLLAEIKLSQNSAKDLDLINIKVGPTVAEIEETSKQLDSDLNG